MERRHGLVPRKEGAKSSTHTNIHTHTRTRKKRKTKKKRKHFDIRSQTYQQCCIPIFFLNFTESLTEFTLFFLSKLLLLFFSHTCQTWSHSTRLQTTESHTHVSFPHRRTNTKGCSEGRWRGRETLCENPH